MKNNSLLGVIISNKRFLLALTNSVLLVQYALLVKHRYVNIEYYYTQILGIEFDFASIVIVMKLDILILLAGLISLIGIIFWAHKKVFFFISTFYASSCLVGLFLSPSFRYFYILLVLAETTFLWLLIWNNTFTVFEKKRGLKLTFLLIGASIYFLIYLSWT